MSIDEREQDDQKIIYPEIGYFDMARAMSHLRKQTQTTEGSRMPAVFPSRVSSFCLSTNWPAFRLALLRMAAPTRACMSFWPAPPLSSLNEHSSHSPDLFRYARWCEFERAHAISTWWCSNDRNRREQTQSNIDQSKDERDWSLDD